MKLKSKYGVSFKPALKPKQNATSSTTQKLLSTMNQGLSSRRNLDTSKDKSEPQPGDPEHQVAVKVLATEVLPVICWSKEAAASKGVTALARGRYNDENLVPLKYFLVDSRPESTAEEQGRFPTAVVVSPEALLDPDRIQQHEEMFESLRGAVHICIMGEGFSAVPHLYNQKLTPKLQHYIEEDESRTSLCALFFVKKGFPFVSILDGGFVQAHAWLCREGPKRHLDAASVLVDYDDTNSFFGRLEKSYRTQQELANASAREKTQHVLQNLLDSSMTTLTRVAADVAAFETETADLKNRKRVSNIVPTEEVEDESEESFVGSPVSGSGGDDEQADAEKSEGSFVSRFAGTVSKLSKKSEKDVVESGEKMDADEKEESADGVESKFKNPFAGFRKAETVTSSADGESGDAKADAGNTPAFRNPFAARRSVVPEKGQSEDKEADETGEDMKEPAEDPDLVDVTIAPTAESNKQGTFSRLARAASSGIQKVSEQNQVSQNAFKRYQFGRFGGAKQSEKPGEKPAAEGESSKKPANRFGGINMNQLRMNTLSNLRGKPAADGGEADLVEESISFDHDGAVASTLEPAVGDDEKVEKPADSAVVEAV